VPPFAREQPVGRLALGREAARTVAGEPRSARVWAAGEALTGSSTVVEAMAQSNEATRGSSSSSPAGRCADPGRGRRRPSRRQAHGILSEWVTELADADGGTVVVTLDLYARATAAESRRVAEAVGARIRPRDRRGTMRPRNNRAKTSMEPKEAS